MQFTSPFQEECEYVMAKVCQLSLLKLHEDTFHLAVLQLTFAFYKSFVCSAHEHEDSLHTSAMVGPTIIAAAGV